MMKTVTTIANALWNASNAPAFFGFSRALNRPRETQLRILQGCLAQNSGCAYGRAHGFATIRTYKEFVRCVPVVEYDEIQPGIDRIRRGEKHVLTTEAATHLIPTAGSSGPRKLIPFTPGLQRQFNCAIGAWVADLARRHPGVLFGPAYWSITPAMQTADTQPSAVPIGFADDASYLGGLKSWVVHKALIQPERINGVTGTEEFRYQTLLCLLQERELRLISVWHPSFLTLLLDALPHYWDGLLEKISKTNTERARELERSDPRRPQTLWPHLQVVSCWGDGPARIPMRQLQARLRGIVVQRKGLLATEAFVTVPFAGLHPLAICSHFFEFVDEQGGVHLADELREQETYEVLVTTAGGLWRYRLGDSVRVTGFIGRTPSLEFLGRVGNVSDLFGEKLSEKFVSTAIEQTIAHCGATARFVLLAPDEDERAYTLYIEGGFPPDVAEVLDAALRENPQYALCRDLGQLLAVRMFAIAEGGYETFVHRAAN